MITRSARGVSGVLATRRPVAGRRSRADADAATARLGCGVVLTYESSSFAPAVGDQVPCRRHGFCVVTTRERVITTIADTSARPLVRRAHRSTADVVAFVAPRHASTLAVLRKHRFPLRLVMAAQAEGMLDVDLMSGRVTMRRP